MVDKTRVQQIVSNLVQNAIKHSKRGGSIAVVVSSFGGTFQSSSDEESSDEMGPRSNAPKLTPYSI